MSRWEDYAPQANAECLNEFYATLDAWIDKREQEDRQQMDQDTKWIHKQVEENAS